MLLQTSTLQLRTYTLLARAIALRPQADFRSDCAIYHVVVQPVFGIWPISSFLQSCVSHARYEEAGA